MTTTQTPVEIDVALAEVWRERDEKIVEKKRAEYNFENCGWRLPAEREQFKAQYQADIDAAKAEIVRLNTEAKALEDLYTGWQRYYLVTNGNGHVHTSTGCSTCFPTTRFAWLPDCSDMSEAELVEEFGEKVCTICCPSAPVTPGLVGRRDRQAQAEKQAEKDAKLAAKLEKALLPDGSALEIPGEGSPKTLIAGQRELSRLVENLLWYGETHPSANRWQNGIEALLTAVSNKTGENRAELRETVFAKQAKKVAKQRG